MTRAPGDRRISRIATGARRASRPTFSAPIAASVQSPSIFRTEDGSRLVRELALQSDVLIENYKVGGLEKYCLAWKDLAPLHPGLIYCSISAFGQSGPAAAKPGYDAMIQAMGGLMSVTGIPDGEPGGGPQKVGVAVSDLLAGMYASTAIIAALYERERSGRGQFIDLALLDTQVARSPTRV